MSRVRPVAVTVAAGALVLVLAACGSSSSRVQVVAPPRLPRTLAGVLAGQSDAVASALRSGNACSAKTRVHVLEHETQAAIASGTSFTLGGALPLLLVLMAAAGHLLPVLVAGCLLSLALLGGLGARAGGAPIAIGAARVTLWGAVAMALTGAVGSGFGALA